MENNTSIVIDLAGRYSAAFGIVKASEMISAAVLNKNNNQYELEFFDDYNKAEEEITIRDFSQNTILKFGDMIFGTVENVFAPPLMVEFSRGKNLIETETNGEDNIIVERWGTRPWDIRMNGILINVDQRQYPKELVRKLNKLFQINEVLEVVGSQFEDKNIHNIYLKDISITPLEGYGDTLNFSLNASSIKEVSWTLIEPDPIKTTAENLIKMRNQPR